MATRKAPKVTAKQFRHPVAVLGKAGYDTVSIDADFKRLGATMSDRNRTVEVRLATKEPRKVCGKSITSPVE
jgi:hypothetical protein